MPGARAPGTVVALWAEASEARVAGPGTSGDYVYVGELTSEVLRVKP